MSQAKNIQQIVCLPFVVIYARTVYNAQNAFERTQTVYELH